MSDIKDFIYKKTAQRLPHSVNRKFEILRRNPTRPRARTVFETGDKYVDRIISCIIKPESGFDPYPLADIQPNLVDFSFLAHFCKLQLRKGFLTGLRYLERAGQCCVRELDGRMHVNVALEVGPMYVTYEGSLGIMCLKKKLIFNAKFSDAEVLVHFSVDASTGRYIQLHKVYIEKLEDPSGYIEGLGPFTRAINSGISNYLRFSEEKVRKYLNGVVQSHLAGVFAQFRLPTQKSHYYASSQRRPPAANLPMQMGKLFAIKEEAE